MRETIDYKFRKIAEHTKWQIFFISISNGKFGPIRAYDNETKTSNTGWTYSAESAQLFADAIDELLRWINQNADSIQSFMQKRKDAGLPLTSDIEAAMKVIDDICRHLGGIPDDVVSENWWRRASAMKFINIKLNNAEYIHFDVPSRKKDKQEGLRQCLAKGYDADKAESILKELIGQERKPQRIAGAFYAAIDAGILSRFPHFDAVEHIINGCSDSSLNDWNEQQSGRTNKKVSGYIEEYRARLDSILSK